MDSIDYQVLGKVRQWLREGEAVALAAVVPASGKA